MSRQRGLLASLPFVGFGLLFIVLTVVPTLRGRQTLFWSETTGMLLRAQAHSYWGHSRAYGSLHGEDYEVRYAYAVGGRHFQSARLSYRSVAYAEFRRLGRQGDPVRVYYDPSHPADSVLFPGEPPLAGSPLFLAGLVLAAIGLVLPIIALLRPES